MFDKFKIPDELIQMIEERRVIPFLGAGFSRGLDFPLWNELLETIAKDINLDMPIEDLKKYCYNNSLQIAEYLYIKANKNIGSLRHSISNQINKEVNLVSSGAHFELINLGAKQIYTTNYDEIIEKTYKYLGLQPEVIVHAEQIAKAKDSSTQVVKFHGDLRYDETLVLTESSYFSRLNFDTPMDLKFRADLLGKSVLFIGYSFQDINIRVIWFRLMEMMSNINDIPKSYMVSLNPNPVLEELYKEVGIETIVLDPEGREKSNTENNKLLAEFMFELVHKAISHKNIIPGTDQRPYVSKSLLDKLDNVLHKYDESRLNKNRTANLFKDKKELFDIQVYGLLQLIMDREIPSDLLTDISTILLKTQSYTFLRVFGCLPIIGKIAIKLAEKQGLNENNASLIVSYIYDKQVRDEFCKKGFNLDELFGYEFKKIDVDFILKNLGDWIIRLEDSKKDPEEDLTDLAYLLDLAIRFKESIIKIDDLSDHDLERIVNWIERASKVIPGVKGYKIEKTPNIKKMLARIETGNKV